MPQREVHRVVGQFGDVGGPTAPGGTQTHGGTGEAAARGAEAAQRVIPFHRDEPKVGRNDPCPCESGKKYKNCHGR